MTQVHDIDLRIIASVALATDDITKLRRADVYRVLSDLAQDALLFEGAQFLIQLRADLADEVAETVEKLKEYT